MGSRVILVANDFSVFKRLSFSVLGFLLLLQSGCQSFQTKYSEQTQAQWEVRALIKDHLRSKTYVAVIDIYAIKNEKLKMDLISPLGDHIGSFYLSGEKIQLLDVPNRAYYYGKASIHSLKPLVNLPIHPHDFYDILFDTKPTSKNWSCKQEDGLLVECNNSLSQIKVEWENRAGSKRTINIAHKSASIQMNFNKFDKKIKEGAFHFKKPKSFKSKRLK